MSQDSGSRSPESEFKGQDSGAGNQDARDKMKELSPVNLLIQESGFRNQDPELKRQDSRIWIHESEIQVSGIRSEGR